MTPAEVGEAVAGLLGLGMGIGAVLRGSASRGEASACAGCVEVRRDVEELRRDHDQLHDRVERDGAKRESMALTLTKILATLRERQRAREERRRSRGDDE